MQGSTSSEAAAEAKPAEPAAQPHPSRQKPPAGHLYEAVSTQRDHVLGAFDTQRSAILKAVADQREAALAPIRSVRARQAAQTGGQGPAGTSQRQQAVAAEIALVLKAMVADEVRAQLAVLLGGAASGSGIADNAAESGRD